MSGSMIIQPTPVQPIQPQTTAVQSVSAPITPSEPIAGVPSIFTQLGFTAVESKEPTLFIVSDGPTGSGKTKFLTTCPPPIGVIDFDKGMKGVAERDVWGNIIVRKTLELPDFDDRGPEDRRGISAPAVSAVEQSVAKSTYEQFKAIMVALFKNLKGGTVCVDNGGSIYTCAMAARFGQLARLGDVPAQMWRMMQLEFENIFNLAYDYNVNLVITHRQKNAFDKPGEKVIDGYDRISFLSQVHLRFEGKIVPRVQPSGLIVVTGPQTIEPPEIQFSARVLKCRSRAALVGQEFQAVWLDQDKTKSMGLDFLTIAKQVVPGTTDQDWIRR